MYLSGCLLKTFLKYCLYQGSIQLNKLLFFSVVKEKKFTAATEDMLQFFEAIEWPMGKMMYSSFRDIVKFQAPGVNISCIYGAGVPTPAAFKSVRITCIKCMQHALFACSMHYFPATCMYIERLANLLA